MVYLNISAHCSPKWCWNCINWVWLESWETCREWAQLHSCVMMLVGIPRWGNFLVNNLMMPPVLAITPDILQEKRKTFPLLWTKQNKNSWCGCGSAAIVFHIFSFLFLINKRPRPPCNTRETATASQAHSSLLLLFYISLKIPCPPPLPLYKAYTQLI